MKKFVGLGLVGLLGACSTQQTQEAAEVVKLVAPFLPNGSGLLSVGQLVCGSIAVFDAATGLPYLVTGRPAQIVNLVCGLVGEAPQAAPAGATLTAQAVVIPPAAK